MRNIEIHPLKGIIIDDIGEVLLGQSKNKLYKLLGKPTSTNQEHRLFYDELEVRVDFDEKEDIEFVNKESIYFFKSSY